MCMEMETGFIVIEGLSVPVWGGRNVTSWWVPREHTWKGYQGGPDDARDTHMISGQAGGQCCSMALQFLDGKHTNLLSSGIRTQWKQKSLPSRLTVVWWKCHQVFCGGNVRQFEPTHTTRMPLCQPKIIEGLIFIYALMPVTFTSLGCFLESKVYWEINQGVRCRGMLGCVSD